jgi:predicted NBD/HSP70 family sugar kinase
LKAGLEKLLEVEYKRHIDVEIEDDCVAAIRGELSSRGALSNLSAGTVVIIGTGGNIGVAKDGDVYFGGREEIREMFQNIIGKFDEAAQRWVWTYTGGFTGKLPRLKEGEKYLEDRISGPNLDRRFAEFGYALESDDGSKKNITEAALGGDEKAKELIVEVGRELGRALAVFFAAYKEEDFVKNTVLVGGVSENLGKGVLDGQGRDLFIGAVQDGVLEGLADLGMKDKDRGLAEEIAKRVVRSKQSYEREFMPFVPLEAARLKVGKVHYAGLNLLEELKALKYKDDETRWSIPINIDTLPGDGEEGIKVLESFLEVLALKQLYLNKRYGGRIRFEFVKIGQDGALEGVTNHRICEIYNGILGRSGFWIGKKKDGCVRSFLITDRAHFPESYGETKVLALEEEMEIEDDSNLCLWNGVLDIAIAQTRLSQESTEIRALYYGRLNKLYKMLGRDLEPDQFTALLEKDIQAAISVARDLAIPPCRRFDMEGLQTLYERMRSLMEQA